jgi:hypothetical protein
VIRCDFGKLPVNPSTHNSVNTKKKKTVKIKGKTETCCEKAWDKDFSLFIAASFLCCNIALTSSTVCGRSSQSSATLLPSLDYQNNHRKDSKHISL